MEITDARSQSANSVLDRQQACIEVREPPKDPAALNVEVSGPQTAMAGQEVRFFVKVNNVGDLPAQQVQIRIELGPMFKVTGVDDRAGLTTTAQGALIWTLNTLQGKSSVTHQIGCECLGLNPGML